MSQVQTVHCNSVLGALKRARHWQHALWMFQLLPGTKIYGFNMIQIPPPEVLKEHDIGVLQGMLRSLRIHRDKDSGKLETCLGSF